MKYLLSFIGLILVLLMLVRRSDTKNRKQIAGTWFQGTHTLTLASDGTYTSIFPDYPKGQTTTFDGKWNIKWGKLVVTGLRSNLVSVPGESEKILRLDEHNLHLGQAALTR